MILSRKLVLKQASVPHQIFPGNYHFAILGTIIYSLYLNFGRASATIGIRARGFLVCSVVAAWSDLPHQKRFLGLLLLYI